MKRFQLFSKSGVIVVIDPMFVDYAQRPINNNIQPVLQNIKFDRANGMRNLYLVEAVAMGTAEIKQELKVIGVYELDNVKSRTVGFNDEDIRRYKPNGDEFKDKLFSVDSAQILVFDLFYLEGVLRHYSWKDAYNEKNQVDRNRERKLSEKIGGRDDIFVQVQAQPSYGGRYFDGDGEFYFKPQAFRLI